MAIEYSGFSDTLSAYTMGLLQALGMVVTPEAVVEEGSSAEYKVVEYSVLNLLMSSAHVFARGVFEPNVFMEEPLAESTEPTVYTFLEEAIGRTDINLDQTLRVAAEYVWRHSIKLIGDALVDPDVSDGTKMRMLDSELLLRSSALYSGKRPPLGLIDSMIEAYNTKGVDDDAVINGDMFDMSAGTYPRPELLGVEANAFNALKLIYTLKSTVSDAYNDPTREQNMGLTDAEKIKAVVTLELIADELNRDPELSDDDIKEIFQEYFGADICTYLTEVIEVDVEKISKSVIIKWGWIDDLSGKAWMNDDDETQESLDDEEFDYRCRYDHDGLNDEYLEDFLLSASDEILEGYDEDHSRDQISY